MKKILAFFSLLLLFTFSNAFADTLSVSPGETRAISFSQELDSISFSKSTDFFIKTLNGGVWSDVGNNVSEYTPLKGYVISNFTGAVLNIDYINKSNITAQDSLLQRTLSAGWNLVGISTTNTGSSDTIVNGLGNGFNYSRVVDFTSTNFSSSNSGTLLGNFNLKNFGDSGTLHESTAYAVFISSEQIISGVQNTTSVSATGTLTELSITGIDPSNSEIREDKVDVILGSIQVVNDSGEQGTLNDFGVRIVTNAGTTGLSNVSDFFTDVKLYNPNTGSGHELITFDTDLDSVFSDTSLDIVIPVGTTTFVIKATTAVSINNFDSTTFNLSLTSGNLDNTTGGFYVTNPNSDDVSFNVGALSYNQIDGAEVIVTATNVPLADTSTTRGASDIVALQFEVESNETSQVSVTEIVAKINSLPIFSGSNLPNSSITEAKLYKGSVSGANLLDQESGGVIANDGTITFNDFSGVNIAANATETFIVTLSFVDSADAVSNSSYNITLTDISVEDDNSDNVSVTTGFTSTRDITVLDYGYVSLSEDSNNSDNQKPKMILAGTSDTVFSIDIQSINESMDIQDVIFTLTGASLSDIKDSVVNASLYLGNTLIDTNSNSDITIASSSGSTLVTFDNMTTLIIDESTSELKLVLNTATIGYQKVGKTLSGLTITHVNLENTQGVDTSHNASNVNESTIVSSKEFSLVPATILPILVTSLSSSATPEFSVNVNVGSNTINESNSTPDVLVTELVLSTIGSSIDVASSGAIFSLFNVDDFGDTVTSTISGSTLTFDLSGFSDQNNATASISETFKISVTGLSAGSNPDTLSLKLPVNGIIYDVINSNGEISNSNSTNLSIQLSNELDMGSRQY